MHTMVKIYRRGSVVHVGKLSSLYRGKEPVAEVSLGMECGIGVEGFHDFQVGDRIEAFLIIEDRPSL